VDQYPRSDAAPLPRLLSRRRIRLRGPDAFRLQRWGAGARGARRLADPPRPGLLHRTGRPSGRAVPDRMRLRCDHRPIHVENLVVVLRMALMVRLLPLVLGLALPASAAGVTDAIAMAREERPVPIPEGGPTAPRLVPPSTPETEDEDGMPSSEGEDPRRSGGEDRPRTGPVEREIAPAGLPAREAPELVPPRPLTTLAVPLPEGVPPPDEEILVRVLLTIDESGAVVDARLLEGAGPPWDDAVLDAARGFSFEPARLGETAVQVEIPYEHRFLPPPPPEPEAPSARLHG